MIRYGPVQMNVKEGFPNPTMQQVIADLRELITALDRRVPRLERAGEASIAHDAAALKHEALARIATLERLAS